MGTDSVLSEKRRDELAGRIEMPAPTPWPMITALGITFLGAGLVTNVTVSVIGFVLALAGAVGWFKEVLPAERHEAVPIEPPAAVVRPARVAVAHLEVGELGHRARLPLEIYPYSAGIKGGIAGGIAMAALAAAYGVVAFGSPWYPINILAASGMSKMASADVAALSAFIPSAFFVAVVIHAVVSLLVGLLYGVMLPMFPRHPAFFGGFVAPLLWTGLLWATLDVINPVLADLIYWRWFIICQIGFGLTAGFVVARAERISTLQHMPFLMRAGVEAPGVSEPEEPQ